MKEESVEGYNNGCLQEALKGFLKCLGLESGGEVVNGGDGATSTAYNPLPSNDSSAIVNEIIHSPVEDIPTTEKLKIDNDHGIENNFSLVTIDEILSNGGGDTAKAHYVELHEGGQTISLLTTSLISSGGGGQTH